MRETTRRAIAASVLVLVATVVAPRSATSEAGAKAIFMSELSLEIAPGVEPVRYGVQEKPPSPRRGRDHHPRVEQRPSGGAEERSAGPRPLAVRYCLRKVDGTGRILGTAPLGQDFHSGDRIQLTVEANVDAHIAIVQHGSDGHRGLLYPAPVEAAVSRPIAGRTEIVLPSLRQSFTFDGTPGTEHLWLVLAREPSRLAALPLRADMDAGDLAALELVVTREAGAKNLVVESLAEPGDSCTYAADVSGRIVVQEIALAHR